jgi:hypothetical protein
MCRIPSANPMEVELHSEGVQALVTGHSMVINGVSLYKISNTYTTNRSKIY